MEGFDVEPVAFLHRDVGEQFLEFDLAHVIADAIAGLAQIKLDIELRHRVAGLHPLRRARDQRGVGLLPGPFVRLHLQLGQDARGALRAQDIVDFARLGPVLEQPGLQDHLFQVKGPALVAQAVDEEQARLAADRPRVARRLQRVEGVAGQVVRAQRAPVAELRLEEEMEMQRRIEQPRLGRVLLERELIRPLLGIVLHIIGDRHPVAVAQECQQILVLGLALGVEFGARLHRLGHRDVAVAMLLDLQEGHLPLIFALADHGDVLGRIGQQQDVLQIPGIIVPAHAAVRRKPRLDAFEPRLELRGGGLRPLRRRDQRRLHLRRPRRELAIDVHLDLLLRDSQPGEVAARLGQVDARLAQRFGHGVQPRRELGQLVLGQRQFRDRDRAVHLRPEAEVGGAVESGVALPRLNDAVLEFQPAHFREHDHVIDALGHRPAAVVDRREPGLEPLQLLILLRHRRRRIIGDALHHRRRHEGAERVVERDERRMVRARGLFLRGERRRRGKRQQRHRGQRGGEVERLSHGISLSSFRRGAHRRGYSVLKKRVSRSIASLTRASDSDPKQMRRWPSPLGP